jgi:hypothetical protein
MEHNKKGDRKNTFEQMPSLLTKNGKEKNPEPVANAVNNFFLTITENLNSHQLGIEHTISFLKYFL